jgi:hypothetical protein
MAEFKTAEQYVVEKVEYLERELDNIKIAHEVERDSKLKEIAELEVELNHAYELLNMFRDFLRVRKSEYFGNCIEFAGTFYPKEKPEEVAKIMEYYDLRPEEDKCDE